MDNKRKLFPWIEKRIIGCDFEVYKEKPDNINEILNGYYSLKIARKYKSDKKWLESVVNVKINSTSYNVVLGNLAYLYNSSSNVYYPESGYEFKLVTLVPLNIDYHIKSIIDGKLMEFKDGFNKELINEVKDMFIISQHEKILVKELRLIFKNNKTISEAFIKNDCFTLREYMNVLERKKVKNKQYHLFKTRYEFAKKNI